MTSKFNNVYILDSFTIAGKYEKNGKISKYFDKIYDKDFYYGMKTFEAAEENMLRDSINSLIDKCNMIDKDIDYIISGDLENQNAASNYAVKDKLIDYLGIYSACSTFGEGLFIAASFIEGGQANNIIVSTSSHNLVAERQFRNPVEYGTLRKKSSTFTATGSASLLVTNKVSKIKLVSITPGRVVDSCIKDVNNMGGVMAIAAANTIMRHLTDMNISTDHYDIILTGDLGVYGKKILIEYLLEHDIDISKNCEDCGLLLYDINNQKVFAGASGPVCSALVLCSYVLSNLRDGTFKRVLVVPTGALFNTTKVNQSENIPSIAFAISLEVNNI